MLTQQQLIKILQQHYITFRICNGKVQVLDEYIVNGELFGKWIQSPKTLTALRAWLGY